MYAFLVKKGHIFIFKPQGVANFPSPYIEWFIFFNLIFVK